MSCRLKERLPVEANSNAIAMPSVTLRNESSTLADGTLAEGTLADGTLADSTLAEESSAGCVIVVEGTELVGILTEQDVVRFIEKHQSPVSLVVADVMTQPVITLSVSDWLGPSTAISMMATHQIHHLPVVDSEGHILGLLTQAQLRQLLDTTASMQVRQVREVMNSSVVHALPTDSISHIGELMAQRRAGYVLISQAVAGKHKRLLPVGIITARDVVQFQLLDLDPQRIQAQAVMSHPLFVARPIDTLWTVKNRMQEHRVQQLVVVSNQDDFLGIITQSSLLPEDLLLEDLSVEDLSQDKPPTRNDRYQASNGDRKESDECVEDREFSRQNIDKLDTDKPNTDKLDTDKLDTDKQGINEPDINEPGINEPDIHKYSVEMNLDDKKQLSDRDRPDSESASKASSEEDYTLSLSDLKAAADKERFFSFSLDLFCVANLNGRFTQVNSAFETTLGHSKEELVSQPYLNFVHPDDRAATQEEMRRLASGDSTIAFENRYRCKDGSYKWLLWNVKPDSEKQLLYGVAKEVTQRKEAELLLRVRAAQQATIAQFGQLALATEDIDELMDRCVRETASGLDAEYCKILEHQPDKGVLLLKAGTGWETGLVGQATVEDGDRSQAGYTLASAQPIIIDNPISETRFTSSPLLLRHQIVSGISTIVPGQQRPYGILGVHTRQHRSFSEDDVNFVQSMANILANAIERYRTERSMQQQLAAVEAAVEGIAILQGDTFISLNRAHLSLFGYEQPAELIGKSWRCLYSPEQIAHFERTVFPALAEKGAWQGEAIAVRKDGSTFAEGLSLTLSQDGLLICVCRDISDRKRAERSLQQSEAVLRSFFNSTPLMMGVVEVRGDEIIHISDNAVTASLFNLTPEEMRRRSDKDMGIPSDIVRMWIGYYRQAAITGQPVRFEYLHTAGDANCWLSATVSTIVEGKNVEKENVEKENVEKKNVGKKNGIDKDIDADINTDIAEESSLQEQNNQHGSSQDRGSRDCASWSETAQSIDGQRFAYVVEDTTERKRIGAKLREQASLLDVATDAILVRDIDGRIAYWNKGAELLYGWTAKEAIGKLADRLLYLDDSVEDGVEASNDKIYQSIKTTGRWQGERTQVTKSGQVVTVMSRWTQVSDFQGQPSSILTVNTDITQAKQLEVQFLRAQRLESIGTLASGIAHDLNNILTPIYGVAHLLPLQVPDADEKVQQQFKILQDSAKRGSEIIRQVLSFSRGMEGSRVPVAIKHVIAEIKSFVHKTFPKSIEISVDIPRDLQMVMGDVTQLHQVFMNFFVNARDAMPNGGCISLSATNLQVDEAFVASHIEAHVGPYILVTVADTGTGIAPEQLDRIFEPFFTTKQTKGGTGLGLSTAHGIIKSHSGFITVYSEVGKGTQFNVYLPAVEEDRDVAAVEASDYPSGNGECILVVDDEMPIREVTRSVLENYNYRVLVAEDGIDAIAQYAQRQAQSKHQANTDSSKDGRIQVVLMDMTMPNLGGSKTIQILQKINPKVKVITVSGLPGNQQMVESVSSAVKAFIPKPYSSTTLLRTLHDVLNTEKS